MTACTLVLRPAVEEFEGKISRSKQASLKATSQGMYSKKQMPNGRVRVTGGKKLKSSGAYTASFGKHVAKLVMKHRIKEARLSSVQSQSTQG